MFTSHVSVATIDGAVRHIGHLVKQVELTDYVLTSVCDDDKWSVYRGHWPNRTMTVYIYIYITYMFKMVLRMTMLLFLWLFIRQDNSVGWKFDMMTSWNATFSALLALCPPVIGGFPSQRPVTQSIDVFLGLNKRLSTRSRRRWFDTPSRSLWRH